MDEGPQWEAQKRKAGGDGRRTVRLVAPDGRVVRELRFGPDSYGKDVAEKLAEYRAEAERRNLAEGARARGATEG